MTTKPPTKPSYHDVVCCYDDPDGKEVRVEMYNSYGYWLHCSNVSGWRLWCNDTGTKDELIAGEYDNAKLRIFVKGIQIL
jgi:hypothetical protein